MLAHDLIFFFNDTATTEIYTLSLHDALPISSNAQYQRKIEWVRRLLEPEAGSGAEANADADRDFRSEEHTSELQSQSNLVCRLLLEKKNARRRATSAVPESGYLRVRRLLFSS